MLKLCGCLLIILGCGYWGWLRGEKLKEEILLISEFIYALAYLKREIVQNQRQIPYMLEELGKRDKSYVGWYFQQQSLRLREKGSDSFAMAGSAAMDDETRLSISLRRILSRLGDVLGHYDGKSQGEVIEQLIEELRCLQETQQEGSKGLMEVYGAVGVTSGLFLIILLL